MLLEEDLFAFDDIHTLLWLADALAAKVVYTLAHGREVGGEAVYAVRVGNTLLYPLHPRLQAHLWPHAIGIRGSEEAGYLINIFFPPTMYNPFGN